MGSGKCNVGRGAEWAWKNPKGLEFLTSPGLSRRHFSPGTFWKQWQSSKKKKKKDNGAVASSRFAVKACRTAASSDQAFV